MATAPSPPGTPPAQSPSQQPGHERDKPGDRTGVAQPEQPSTRPDEVTIPPGGEPGTPQIAPTEPAADPGRERERDPRR